jgi:Txe/YoeB family toxin of Txe-Axe toxin-antitoxin module
MQRDIRFTSPVWAHHQYGTVRDKATLRRINALSTDALRAPYDETK